MKFLRHPLARHLDIDDPQTTIIRRHIINSKPFLNSIYREWYQRLDIPPEGIVVELGSGGGFLSSVHAQVIMTEIFHLAHISLVANATCLPFRSGSVRMFALVDVFHHIPNVGKFLAEAERCLEERGEIAMIEPWHTVWSRFIYQHLHPEPFEPGADWSIPTSGPLTGANGALPWIVFERDLHVFRRLFPNLTLNTKTLMMPISYLLSGGVSMRSLMPGFLYSFIRFIENRLPHDLFAMFALLRISKNI